MSLSIEKVSSYIAELNKMLYSQMEVVIRFTDAEIEYPVGEVLNYRSHSLEHMSLKPKRFLFWNTLVLFITNLRIFLCSMYFFISHSYFWSYT